MESQIAMIWHQLSAVLAALMASIPHDTTMYILAALVVLVWGAHFALSREIRKSTVRAESRDNGLRK